MSANFRTRMFGGFDREDVVAYIGKITKENQAQVEELTSAANELRQQNDGLIRQLAVLHRQVKSCEDSHRENEVLTQQVQRLEEENRAAQEALRQTQARCDELQVQADEYAKIRDHIADIEISAHRRTEEFRAQTIQRIHELVAQQRAWCSENSVRYEKLLQSFGEKLQAARDVLRKRISPDLRRCSAAWIGWMRNWTSNFLTQKPDACICRHPVFYWLIWIRSSQSLLSSSPDRRNLVPGILHSLAQHIVRDLRTRCNGGGLFLKVHMGADPGQGVQRALHMGGTVGTHHTLNGQSSVHTGFLLFFSLIYLCCFFFCYRAGRPLPQAQAQGIGHHTHGAETHGRGSDHGV